MEWREVANEEESQKSKVGERERGQTDPGRRGIAAGISGERWPLSADPREG
jgi:hypothetical protein